MREIKGDLIKLALAGEFQVIAHGCNCRHTMGAGIAEQIAKTFPMASSVDSGFNRYLGDISCAWFKNENNDCLQVINAYTQIHWGMNNRRHRQDHPTKGKLVDSKENRYMAIRESMKTINWLFSGQSIGIPLIGCGKARGDWKVVKKILEEELIDMDVTIVHYDK